MEHIALKRMPSATHEILEPRLKRYPELGNTVDSILKAIGEDR